MKHILMLVAVLALSARPLYALNSGEEGLPEFNDIAIEAVEAVVVPAVGYPVVVETPVTENDPDYMYVQRPTRPDRRAPLYPARSTL